MDNIKKKSPAIEWLGRKPLGPGKVALLIPEFNEETRTDMLARLQYFHELATSNQDLIDVIIIDDGSTDGSFAIIKKFKESHPKSFYLASVTPNAKKVGALYLATAAVDHEFVIHSDFDTDLHNIQLISDEIDLIKNDDRLMGCYFRMIPVYGRGMLFSFQRLEYSIARTLYRLVIKEGSVPVMPGAGSCYKRAVLMTIYQDHSGNWCGEDREATLIGLKYGYRAFYKKDITAYTRPPSSFRSLLLQRIRWNLGFIETFHKEKDFYVSQITKGSRFGLRTLLDIFNVGFIILLPVFLLTALAIGIKPLLAFLGVVYILSVLWCSAAFVVSPAEVKELKAQSLGHVAIYPVIKVTLDFLAWGGAFMKFFMSTTTRPGLSKMVLVNVVKEEKVETKSFSKTQNIA